VPALGRDVLGAAERQPDVARRNAGGEGLIRRPVAQRHHHRVLAEDATERAELLGDRAIELAELQVLGVSG
jgi:hypothetical protein